MKPCHKNIDYCSVLWVSILPTLNYTLSELFSKLLEVKATARRTMSPTRANIVIGRTNRTMMAPSSALHRRPHSSSTEISNIEYVQSITAHYRTKIHNIITHTSPASYRSKHRVCIAVNHINKSGVGRVQSNIRWVT